VLIGNVQINFGVIRYR